MQADLAFPQSLAEKYRPLRIADFIGLERPKKVLAAFCKRPCVWRLAFRRAHLASAKPRWRLHSPVNYRRGVAHDSQPKVQRAEHRRHRAALLVHADDAGRIPRRARRRGRPDDKCRATGVALQAGFDRSRTQHNLDFHRERHRAPRAVGFSPVARCWSFPATVWPGRSPAFWIVSGTAEGGNGNGPDLARFAKDSRNNVRDA